MLFEAIGALRIRCIGVWMLCFTKTIAEFAKVMLPKSLVYYEAAPSILRAIEREKQLKKWRREWKLGLIEQSNPHWEDLYDEILQ